MNRLIFPEIFNGNIKAFFTTKSPGVDIDGISTFLSMRKEDIYLPIQRHTDKVLIVNSDLELKIADAVVTKRRGLLIGVQVADCVPILMYDREQSIVGAVHAGWRGTAAGLTKKVIALMITHFQSKPGDILIALGPSIRWSCYQVRREVKDAIYNATGEGEYFLQSKEEICVDLASANLYQALSLGILEDNMWISQECTYCNPEEYYSYRYTKKLSGAQGGFIGIF